MADLLEFLVFVGERACFVCFDGVGYLIMKHPLLLLMTGISFLGACIGILGRLLSRG